MPGGSRSFGDSHVRYVCVVNPVCMHPSSRGEATSRTYNPAGASCSRDLQLR